MRDFLWEGLDGKNNHSVCWEVVGKAKLAGGLGVGSLKDRSAALRAKWLWRFPNEPIALWHKVIRSIYGLEANGWDAKPAIRGSSRSPWRDISSGYNLFLHGCVFVVGSGVRVRFWEDEWSQGGVLKEAFPRLFNLSSKHNHCISSFMDSDGFPPSWDFGFRRNLNELEIGEATSLLDLLEGVRLVTPRLDKRRWKLDPSGWATDLSAGEEDSSLDFSFFRVDIDLTDAGHEHMQDIVGLLFKYISLLQQSGICKWIFDELSAVCETKFHYQDKIQPINYVVSISPNMQKYPPKDWLVRSSLPSNFSTDIIQMVLNKLSPNNVRIFWESKKFEGQTNMVEPWYGTAYSIERITGSMIQEWIVSSPNENLHLPAPNVFIPTDLSLKNNHEKAKYPVLLRKLPYSTLWHKPDTMFSTPKAYVKIVFTCPHASDSPEAEVLTNIFTQLLMDYLNEFAYYAQVAGLNYGIRHTNSGFQMILTGYNHKLRILLETVVEKITSFEVKADRFSVIKEMVTKEYQNCKFQQAMYYCSLILQDHTWPWMEELDVLPHLEVEDLAKFVPMMLSRAFLECYTAGNLERNEAESMIQHIEDALFKGSNPICQPLFPSQHLTNRVVKLEKGKSYFYPVEGLNPSDENSALIHYIQVHRDDFMLNVKLQLFALIAKQPAFHQLRSVEQLGYITALSQRNDCGIRGAQFIIQSTVKDPAHIDLRAEEFLKVFESKLYEMTNEEFKSNVNALIDMKLEKHKNLREEAAFYWREISAGTLKFDRIESEIAALRQLTQQELIDFFNEHIKVGAPHKRTLSVRVYGNSHSSEYKIDKSSPAQASSFKIDDIFSFRRSQPLYGSFKGNHVKL